MILTQHIICMPLIILASNPLIFYIKIIVFIILNNSNCKVEL